ncbi:MAG: hypothetical protein MJA29_00620, partial [Candidatus Omnitrophica bacterium]|nr:hypothetical protein [Candidatus Omnitrophota bacterium]
VATIDGTQLTFGVSIPREELLSISVDAPVVLATQTLLNSVAPFVGDFDGDVDDVSRVMSPLLSRPTTAQIADASRVLTAIKTNLESLRSVLDSVVVRADRSSFATTSERIVSALEDRGLDRAAELLSTGRFSNFFSLDKSNAAKSSRFLTAMETTATSDVPVSFIEEDIDDGLKVDGTVPSDPLDAVEVDDEEILGPEDD